MSRLGLIRENEFFSRFWKGPDTKIKKDLIDRVFSSKFEGLSSQVSDKVHDQVFLPIFRSLQCRD